MTTARQSVLCAVALVTALYGSAAVAENGSVGGQWPYYAGDAGSRSYSPLDQINEDNVGDLEIAWRWQSPDNEIAATNRRVIPFIYEATPIVVDGVMYVSTSTSQVAAIDPSTGESIWEFDPQSWKDGRPTNLGFVHRGVAYWADGEDKRIFIGTGNAFLWALDAKTGKPVESFGDGGKVDIKSMLRRNARHSQYQISSPPVVCRDVVIVGSSIFDRPSLKEAPPGDVHAFNVRTGELAWRFSNPPLPGEVGYDTWKDGSADYTGNANVWTLMSTDEELGYVYLPFSTPTNDFYGGHRKGDGLFSESLVCVEAETGKLVWYFQTTHHGLWDYDLCAAPILADVTVDGKPRKIVAQISKQGFMYVFDRVTGKPIWPIEERPVPQSNVDGEETSPTQPFPTKPAAYERQGLTPDEVIDFTPEIKAAALKILEDFHYGSLYTPPSTDKYTVYMPGYGGGANWTGAALDPETGYIFVPSFTSPHSIILLKPDAARSNFKYLASSESVRGPEGLPISKPPYGRITAIDLNTGEHAWQATVGDGPRDHPLLKDLNLPPLGSASRMHPLVTKTLLFVASGSFRTRGGGTKEEPKMVPNFRAFDKKTGKAVWETMLPVSATGTPMTYMDGGKQYIVFATGGRRLPTELIAMSLP